MKLLDGFQDRVDFFLIFSKKPAILLNNAKEVIYVRNK